MGRTPTFNEMIKEYGGGIRPMITQKFSSYLGLLGVLKIKPGVSSKNPLYSKKYFIKKAKSAIKRGKPLIVSELFNRSETQGLYRHFKSKSAWLKSIL